MKPISYRTLVAVLALGLGTEMLAVDRSDYPQVSLVGPGAGKNPVDRSQFIILVVEGSFVSHDSHPIPATGLVEYVNNVLKTRKVAYIGVYTREGVKYGDVVQAIDVLRKTNASNIGVSMAQLAPGREP